MATSLTFDEVEQIGKELQKKGYIISIDGDKKTIQAILKTAFEKEIINRINEIKSIILEHRYIKNIEKQIEVRNIQYKNKIQKAIEIKF